MSKEGDKATVFRTTKVRTRLRDDGSWLQRRNQTEDEPDEVKPWVAEVKASRVNGAPIETSPVSSPTKPTPPPTEPASQRTPTSGFMIRGIFTKLDKPDPPAKKPTTNGTIGTTPFTKKPSESYKKLAPFTVKPTVENPASTLSPEEQEKRTEAASNILRKSAGKQRSYVLSAAKKFESKAEQPEPVNNTVAFVAKRVEITEDEESPAAPAPATSPPPSTGAPITSVPQAKPPKPVTKPVDVAVKKPEEPKVAADPTPVPSKEEPAPVSPPEKDPFEDLTPGCTKVATPLPELITDVIEAVRTEPKPEDSNVSGKVDEPLVDLAPVLPTPVSPTPASPPAVPLTPTPASPPAVPLTPTPASPPAVPLIPTPMSPPPPPAVPLSPTPVSPTPPPAVPLSPTPVSPTPPPTVPLSPIPVAPPQAPDVPLSPPLVAPISAPEVPLSTAPVAPISAPEAPLSPTPVASISAPEAPLSPTPVAPISAPEVPLSPALVAPISAPEVPLSTALVAPISAPEVPLSTALVAPISASEVPLSPALVAPISAPEVPLSPAPVAPISAPEVPLSPAPVAPISAPEVPLSPALVAPISAPEVPLSPALVAPISAPEAPLSPAPVAPISAPEPTLSPTPVAPISAPEPTLSPTPVAPISAPEVPISPTLDAHTPVPAVSLSPTPVSPAPVSPTLVSAVKQIAEKKEPEPEPEQEQEPKPEQEPEPSPKPSSSVDTLSALSDTLISFNTGPTSVKDDEPELAEKEGGSADSHTAEDGAEEEPEVSDSIPMTDDLLALNDGPEEPAEPVPPSPGRWSQDLLSGLDSEPTPAKTSGPLDLLSDEVIVSNREERSLSTQPEEEKPTDETAKETQSPTETVTVTKTVIITDKSGDSADPLSSREQTTTVTTSSSADPFDPYPIGTTSPNSSSDLLKPLADISINSAPTTSVENEDPNPESFLSKRRSWTRSWDSSTTPQTYTEETSKDEKPEGRAEDQNTVVMFERKSKENDSPWDRWTTPTVYNIATTDDEEEEEEDIPEDAQTQTVTTITTLREKYTEREPVMDRYDTYTRTVREEDRRVPTPEPESKKGFVYVKEYVNTTELSLHNATDRPDSGLDYLTSTSSNYSYRSPSSYSSGSLTSTCNYCGKPVGNDAKISIEHLNINCHPSCFQCGVCGKPMGDLLYSMFLHDGKVHCESCYSRALD